MPVLLPCARRFITRFIFVCLAGVPGPGRRHGRRSKSEPGQIEARQDEPAVLTFWNREGGDPARRDRGHLTRGAG
jgi:hypothetical protein